MRLLISARRRPPSTPDLFSNSASCSQVALDFLQHLGAHVAARGDGQDVDEAGHGRAAAPLAGLLVVVQRLVVEVVQAQEGAHALVEWLLENERRAAAGGGRELLCRRGFLDHHGIVHNSAGRRKCSAATCRRIRTVIRPAAGSAVQRLHLRRQCRGVGFVDDHVVRRGQARCARGLRIEDACAPARGSRPSRAISRCSCSSGSAVHDQHAVVIALRSGFHQQRHGDDLVGAAGLCATAAPRGSRMAGCVMASSWARAAGSANTMSRSRARSSVPSALQYLRRRSCSTSWARAGDAGRDHVARNLVGIDEPCAQRLEQARHRALAAGHTARQRDARHRARDFSAGRTGRGSARPARAPTSA